MNKQNESIFVGRILTIKKHPNADRLFTAEVDINKSAAVKVIFGKMAVVNEGDLVPVAVAPTVLPTGIKIELRNIRGVVTEGMLCLDSELRVDGEETLTKFPPNIAVGSLVSDVGCP